MGLFSSGPASNPAELELVERLKIHPMLGIIGKAVFDEDYKWISQRTGYYDNGQRRVYIGKDYFAIWAKMREPILYRNEQGECKLQLDEVKEPVISSTTLTDLGFAPFHIYRSVGGKTVDERRVIYLWTETVQKFLQEKLPGAEFGIISDAGKNGIKGFTYTLPELKMLDWLTLN